MKKLFLSFLVLVFFFLPFVALAQTGGGDESCNKLNRDFEVFTGGQVAPETLSANCLSTGDTIAKVTQYALLVAGILAVVVIIYAGIRFITSAGSPESHKKARSALLYAVIGLIVVLLASAIVAVVGALITRSSP